MRIEFDGGWVDVREVTFGDVRAISKLSTSELDQSAALLQRVITGWSYDRPVDEAGIDALPLPVFSLLSKNITDGSLGDSRPLGNGSISNASAFTSMASEPASPVQTN